MPDHQPRVLDVPRPEGGALRLVSHAACLSSSRISPTPHRGPPTRSLEPRQCPACLAPPHHSVERHHRTVSGTGSADDLDGPAQERAPRHAPRVSGASEWSRTDHGVRIRTPRGPEPAPTADREPSPTRRPLPPRCSRSQPSGTRRIHTFTGTQQDRPPAIQHAAGTPTATTWRPKPTNLPYQVPSGRVSERGYRNDVRRVIRAGHSAAGHMLGTSDTEEVSRFRGGNIASDIAERPSPRQHTTSMHIDYRLPYRCAAYRPRRSRRSPRAGMPVADDLGAASAPDLGPFHRANVPPSLEAPCDLSH